MSSDELEAAQAAMDEGNFEVARHHLNNARVENPNNFEIEHMEVVLEHKENAYRAKYSSRLRAAFAAGLGGYLILSVVQPSTWTPFVWVPLAFLIVPGLVGAFAGNSIFAPHGQPGSGSRFLRGFLVGFLAMGLYTLVNTIQVKNRIQTGSGPSDIEVIGFVTLFYGLIAGLVAGIVGSRFQIKVKQ